MNKSSKKNPLPGNGTAILIMASVKWYNAIAHYALFLAECLRGQEFHVSIFGVPGGAFLNKAADRSFVTIDGIDLIDPNPIRYLVNLFRFRRLVKKGNYAVIHPHASRDHTFAAIALAGSGIPIVRTRNDSIPPNNHLLNRLFYRHTARFHTVACPNALDSLYSMGIEKSRCFAIPLGIDYTAYAAYKPRRNLRKTLAIPPGATVLSYVGRLHEVKGVEYFIRSLAHITSKNIFVIVSGEEIDVYRRDLKKISDAAGFQNIAFIDRIDDAREILAITHIGVIPSIGSEAVCRIALEMTSFGIPIIGTDVNSIPGIIVPFGGMVVPPRDVDAMAKAIELMLYRKHYRRLGQTIRKKLATLSPRKFTAEYMDLYFRAIERSGAGPIKNKG